MDSKGMDSGDERHRFAVKRRPWRWRWRLAYGPGVQPESVSRQPPISGTRGVLFRNNGGTGGPVFRKRHARQQAPTLTDLEHQQSIALVDIQD